MAKVAVILSGCGHMDGTEIHEAVLSLLELKRQGHSYQCFAPNLDQRYVMDHISKTKVNEKRNMLHEAARIARGEVKKVEELLADEFDALYFPGGFGAAINLCDYGVKKKEYQLLDGLKEFIIAFYDDKKPIGATCIAPVILAKALEGKTSLTLTLGLDPSHEEFLSSLGHNAQLVDAAQFCKDERNLVYTTPCYMEKADISMIHVGIEKMIEAMFKK